MQWIDGDVMWWLLEAVLAKCWGFFLPYYIFTIIIIIWMKE